jgi:hypothetical protein
MDIEREKALTFEKLKTLTDLSGLTNAKALHYLACLIDLSGDYTNPAAMKKALLWAGELKARELSEREEIELAYFMANAWHNKAVLRHQDPDEARQWEQPEILTEILNLRRARRHSGFPTTNPVRQAQILTNLGSRLNTLGRFSEAIGYWNEALIARPSFGMARGNRGLGRLTYGRALFDGGHKALFCVAAYRDLEYALSPEANFEGYDDRFAKQAFLEQKNWIGERLKVDAIENTIDQNGFSLGRSTRERAYRKWALSECLFLNPLNDLGAWPIAATDSFGLPTFTTAASEPPTWIGFFNQLKQEFVSARWAYWDGVNAQRSHFSDRDVTMLNTLDYPAYGWGAEQVRMAFRMAYSLFDKTAFFLNDYARLGIPERDVYFRSLWFDPKTKKLRPEFIQRINLPWRGLYWLSKDFFDSALTATADPDAEALSKIRNRLEHSYLKLHEIGAGNPSGDLFHDRLAYSLSSESFQRRTLRLLKRARAALIYLSLGMHQDERQRQASEKSGEALALPMTIETFDEKRKR